MNGPPIETVVCVANAHFYAGWSSSTHRQNAILRECKEIVCLLSVGTASRYRCRQETATFGLTITVFRKNSGTSGHHGPLGRHCSRLFFSSHREHRGVHDAKIDVFFSSSSSPLFFRPSWCFFLPPIGPPLSRSGHHCKRITFSRGAEICSQKQRPESRIAARSLRK